MPSTTNSDSEDDLDYVPPPDDHGSDMSDEQGVGHTTERVAPPELDPTEQKRQRDALWASFQASVSTPSHLTSSNGFSQTPSEVKRVKIEKTYLFAGKHVTEVVEVFEGSEDAKEWPRWSPQSPRPSSSVPVPAPSSEKGSDNSAPPPPVEPGPSVPTTAPASVSTPMVKRPGPRKPRTTLPSLSKASQAKKITTLDKSAMDWRQHVASQSSHVQDELDANRRGGGYLEKVDFLQRVQGRREDAFEASKANKRRKT